MNDSPFFPYSYWLKLAGISLPCSFFNKDAASYFGGYCVPRDDERLGVHVPTQEKEAWLRSGQAFNGYCEFSCLTAAASDALSSYDCCVAHAAAFRFRDRAYLISAPSGTGKSTQLQALQSLLPGQISVICGDRPVLRFVDERIFVYPSPWNGKENWFGAEACAMHGFICLDRGVENSLRELSPREAAHPVFNALISTRENRNLIVRFGRFAERILSAVKVWGLTSHEVPDSTEKMMEVLVSEDNDP